MKRALSLIIVLAMVLCMIPFSAFAADFEIAGDYKDSVITLTAEDGFEATYLWTATEAGTVEFFADAVVADGEETSTVIPYIKVVANNAEYTGDDHTDAIPVEAGDSLEITIGDDASVGGEVNVYSIFKGLPGTETNPKALQYPLTPMYPNPTTDAIEPGVTEYYVLQGYSGQNVVISGLGVKVVTVLDGEVYGGEATTESVTFTVPAGQMNYVLKITNKADAAQVYTVSTVVQVGTMDNPEVVPAGEYTAEIEAGSWGYYYTYYAEGDGTVDVTVSAADAEGNTLCSLLVVNNLTSYFYGDQTIDGYWSVEVSEGDEISIMVSTFDEANQFYAPAGTVTTTIAFEAAEVEPEGPIVIESLPYDATHSGVYEQMYSYTATANGYLYIASAEGGWAEANIEGTMNWAEGYKDGYILAMNEGEVALINLYAYWGEDTYNYTISWMDTVEPDGSYGFPFVVDTLLNGEVTLANDTEDAVYYTYTAEKTGKIYNAFLEETIDVVEGEAVQFYVPAGGITVGYVPPVATIGSAEYFSLESALAEVKANETITLKDNVEAGYVLIPENVTLDIGAYDLTANYVIGVNGSMLNASTGRYSGRDVDHGRVFVDQDKLKLSVAPDNGDNKVAPYWDPVDECYVLANLRIKDVANAVVIDKERDSIFFRFSYGAGGKANTDFLGDGADDNAIQFALRLSWENDDGIAYQDFVYKNEYVKNLVTSGGNFTFELIGCSILGIDLDDFDIVGMALLDCGITLKGTKY